MKSPLIRILPALGLMTGSTALANDSLNSELSHFAGNAAIAGATTVVVDRFAGESTLSSGGVASA